MKLWLFWIFGGIDALICIVVLVFFSIGLADGSVSSFNAGIWTVIWVALASIMAGGFWLKIRPRFHPPPAISAEKPLHSASNHYKYLELSKYKSSESFSGQAGNGRVGA